MTRTPEETINRACTQKQRLSMAVARARATKKRAIGNHLTAYRCPFCKWWHVGHPPTMSALEDLAAAIRSAAYGESELTPAQEVAP